MITNSATWDLVLWALFWTIMVGAFWGIVLDAGGWLKRDADARDSIRNYPAEFEGESGPERSAKTEK